MGEIVPAVVACTLSVSELRDREGAWRKLLGSGLVDRTDIPGGVQLSAAPGAAAVLMTLIDLERECCAWIHFEVPNATTVRLTADGDGATVLAGMFLAP
jgi:hypothetical protein